MGRMIRVTTYQLVEIDALPVTVAPGATVRQIVSQQFPRLAKRRTGQRL